MDLYITLIKARDSTKTEVFWDFPSGPGVKNPPVMQGTRV